jgi:Rps23 Pro-64 3,4-dihydroxylase Tpa1-like proline 4-hydroxylase
MPMSLLRLNASLDRRELASRFAATGRIQILDFLHPADAEGLADAALRIDWQLVLNTGTRHVDLPRPQLELMGRQRLDAVVAEIEKRAANEFQYLYENYPLGDLADRGALADPLLAAGYATLNSEGVRAFLRDVTGIATAFCDMQATRYGPGHFLTVHDDEAGPAKNRKLAYVLSLTEGWSPVWGGQLQFLDGQRVVESFTPKFNTLSLFRVPTPHHVSQVASFAPKGRISLTGWFRTRG